MPDRSDGRQLAMSALEVVQNQLVLRINEKNEQLKWCAYNQTQHKAIMESSALDLIVDAGDGDLLYEPRTTAADEAELCGTQALMSVLRQRNGFIKRVRLLKLENSFMIERLLVQNMRSQVANLDEVTNRKIDDLEEDPSIGNIKLSALTKISERLFKTGEAEEQRQYILKWNESMRQLIDDIDKVEFDKYQWEHFDKRAKRLELQVKLYSFQMLSVASQKAIIYFPLLELENRYLTESALRRIFNLKLKWLKGHTREV